MLSEDDDLYKSMYTYTMVVKQPFMLLLLKKVSFEKRNTFKHFGKR